MRLLLSLAVLVGAGCGKSEEIKRLEAERSEMIASWQTMVGSYAELEDRRRNEFESWGSKCARKKMDASCTWGARCMCVKSTHTWESK